MKAAASDNDGRHLSEAQMIAYCRGEMSAPEFEASQAHLEGCEQCIALFRSARDFLEPARPDEQDITPAETGEAWRALSDRLQIAATVQPRSSEPKVVHGDFQRPHDRTFFTNARITLAMAATLVISLGVLGLLGWRYWKERQALRQTQAAAAQLENKQRELEQRLAQLEQTGGDQLKQEREQRIAAETKRDQLQDQLASVQKTWQNIPIYSRTLSSERGGTDDLSLIVTPGTRVGLMRLLRSKPYEFPEYSIELVGPDGKTVQEFSGLRPVGDDGALAFLLNTATLNNGKYKLRLFGQKAKTRTPLGEYGLSVTLGR